MVFFFKQTIFYFLFLVGKEHRRDGLRTWFDPSSSLFILFSWHWTFSWNHWSLAGEWSLIQKLKQNRFKVGSAIFAGDLGCVLFDFFSYNILFETDPRYLFKNVEINICFFREIHSFSQHWNHCAHRSRNLQIFFL